MKTLLTTMVCLTILVGGAWPTTAGAGDELRLSIAQYRRGMYVKPPNNSITVGRRPYPFYVTLENISSRNVEIYSQRRDVLEPEHLEFEFTGLGNRKYVVRHKEAPSSSAQRSFRRMAPDELMVASVLIHPDDWENVPVIEGDKDTEFTVRVIYVNKSKRIYSPAYKVTMLSPQHF